MKLFVIHSCLLVLLIAALGQSLVVNSGLEDDEKIQARCTNPCPTPCDNPDPDSTGTCFEGTCCPEACIDEDGYQRRCNANFDCISGSCYFGTPCCEECTLSPNDNCEAGDCTGCTATESCRCTPGPILSPNYCSCACDDSKCAAPVGGLCGTTSCPGKGVTCKCNEGTCDCGPCTDTQCAKDCNNAKLGDTGKCDGTGTCVCTTPPTSPCTSKCHTEMTFNVQTC